MSAMMTCTAAGELTMSSLRIAELTGKLHKDVMKAIRTMEEAWVKVNGRKFALVDYTDAKGEKRPCYQLTKTELRAKNIVELRLSNVGVRTRTPNHLIAGYMEVVETDMCPVTFCLFARIRQEAEYS